MPIDRYRVHRLRYPLVVPKDFADNPDLRIRATELIVADVLDHQPVWTDQPEVAAECAGLPRVQPRSGRVEPCFVDPAITRVLPGGELQRIRRVGKVHDVQ